MVKKAPSNSKLVINTATKKEAPKTVVNLSKTVSVSVDYMLANGQRTGTVLPPTNRFLLPEGATLLTKSEHLKMI